MTTTDRLGWIRAPRVSLAQWPGFERLAAEAARDGLTRVLVLGMGGSSLAPGVLAESFGAPQLQVLDSTDPAAVLAAEGAADLAHTLFVVTSKSGTTVETISFYRYFAARARPEQFVAITDPGTPLEALGRERRFRAVLEHPADVGGRYAALTVVGMLPAALIGVDGRVLLERALALDEKLARGLGARLAVAARNGRDKLVLRPPAAVASLAPWIEQLVAESSGKGGRGVIPIVGDSGETPRRDGEVVTEFSADPLDLGAEFLRWEYATWELCEALGVDAFDQPDVEEAKRLAQGELERPRGAPGGGGGEVPLTLSPHQLRLAARPGDYLAILAYLPPSSTIAAHLREVRATWARALGCATTVGVGPRYLHSTGQLHKGGPNTGLFLVVTADDAVDAEIPGLGRTFGELKRAQAIGDVRALLAKGRRVAQVHFAQAEDVVQLAAP